MSSGWSQEITLIDANTGDPIENVAVYNNDRTKTTVTDFDGRCSIDLFDSRERIFFKHISYEAFVTTKQQIVKKKNQVLLFLKPEQLDEVVMSISRWEQQKKDIPQKVTSISAKAIELSAPQTAADLLQSSGKVFVQKSQSGGGSPLIRGFATNRVLIAVDAVRLNTAIFRGGNVQNVISIDPFTIGSTEIIFGPGSTIYGSDAIGGVMNFITKKPRFSFNKELAFSGKAAYRFSSANQESTAHVDFNFGREKWASLTQITLNRFGDLTTGNNGPSRFLRPNRVVRRNGEDVLIETENPRLQTPSDYDQINLLQKFSFKPNNAWNYDLNLHYSATSDYDRFDRLIQPANDGDGLRFAEWFFGPQVWFLGNFQITKKGNGKFYDNVKVTTAYQHFEESRNDRRFQEDILTSRVENVDVISNNIDFENKNLGDLKLYYGTEYIFNLVSSDGSQRNIETNEVGDASSRYPDGSTWQTLAGYINGEYRLKPNFTLSGGIRYSQVWLNAELNNVTFDFPFEEANISTGALTGSIGFSWFPWKNFQFTYNASTGFRAPNIDDIGKIFDSEPGSLVVPNPNLSPEFAYSTEIGIRTNINDKLVLKGAAYYTFLDNALVRRDFEFNGVNEIEFGGEISNVQAIQNAASAFIYGFEFGLEAFVTENLSLNGNLTITEGTEEDNDGVQSAVRHVAPTFLDFHVLWKGPRLTADLFFNFNGEIPFDDLALSERNSAFQYDLDENGNPFSPRWHTLNLRTQFAFTNALKATGSIENITNQLYRTYSSGISAPGTNLILGLAYTF